MFLFVGTNVFAQGIPAPAAITPDDLVDGDTFYVMFVTSSTHPGNLETAVDYDAVVNTTANSSGFYGTDDAALAGQWRAFIAHDDGTNRAEASLGAFSEDSTVPIYRIDGTRLANDRADLLDNTIAVPINVTEQGGLLPSELVWTGMLASGATLAGLGPTGSATYGQTNADDSVWLEGGSSGNASLAMHLYAVSPLLRVGAPTGGGTIFADGFEAFQCTPDNFEPNNSRDEAASVAAGLYTGLTLCPDDPSDYFRITLPAGATIQTQILFSHAHSDLDLFLLDQDGAVLASSESSSDNENASYQSASAGPVDVFILATLLDGAGAGYHLSIVIE